MATPGKISPLKSSFPVGDPSWIATLCGVPWSSFTNAIVNGLSFGAVIDDSIGDEVRVTVIATGFDRRSSERPVAAFAAGGKQREGGFLRRPKPAEQEDTGEFSMPPTDPLEIPSFLREE